MIKINLTSEFNFFFSILAITLSSSFFLGLRNGKKTDNKIFEGLSLNKENEFLIHSSQVEL